MDIINYGGVIMKARKKTEIEVIPYNSYNLREILDRCNNANF